MFRKLTRIKQQLSHAECAGVLKTALRGTLALNGDDGYPYAVTLNHYYDEESDTVYFHSGKAGYKLDCIDRSDKACFTVTDDGQHHDGEWWLTIKSVVIFGRIRRIEDPETIARISRALSHKFTQDEEYIDREIDRYAPATLLLALQIEDTQGKIVREK